MPKAPHATPSLSVLLSQARTALAAGKAAQAHTLLSGVPLGQVTDPIAAEARYLRGIAAHMLGYDGEALTLIRAVAENGPISARRDPAVWRNLAAVALNLLALNVAHRAIRQAARLSPKGDRDPAGLLLLGEICLALGQRDTAEEAWRALLSATPTHGGAWVRLVDAGMSDDKDLSALRGARNAAPDNKSLAFAWAHALPKESEDRFEALLAANALARRDQPPWDRDRARTRILHALNHATQSRAAAPPAPRSPDPNAPAGVLFITGMLRSGSTLLERLLARHPQVRGIGESTALPMALHDPRGAFLASPWTTEPRAVSVRYLKTVALCHGTLEKGGGGGGGQSWLVDKNLENLATLGQIMLAFPENGPGLRGIALVTERDPLDVALSCFEQNFRHHAWSTDLREIGQRLALSDWCLARWTNLLGEETVRTVAYDALVTDPEGTVTPLLTTMGLDPSARPSADAPDKAGRTASKFQANRPVHRDSLGRARGWEERLAPVLEARAAYRAELEKNAGT